MKFTWVTCIFVMLLAVVTRLPGEQSDADRKLFEDIKVKAENGSAGSQSYIGFLYYSGLGVAKNTSEAVKWFRKAADQGDVRAEDSLAMCYEKGEGVTQDYAEAVKWYRKAADQGYAPAQNSLGDCYHLGQGIAQDNTEAMKWFRMSAKQGNDMAQFNIGNFYYEGNAVIKDAAEAVSWWSKAANQGNSIAQYNLGASYANGDGVPKNYIQAYKWVSLSTAQGYAHAKKFLAVIEMRMTPEQVAEAQKISAAFVPQKEIQNSAAFVPADGPKFTGTGFFITDDGYLISNYHVVKDAAKVGLLTGTGLIDAAVVKVDAANDLVLLKATGASKPLPITASRTMKLGGTVATVGFPDIGLQGFAPKLAKGEIASLSGSQDDPRYFQISVPVQPGNSGGALVDARGNVVGIVAAKLDASVALAATGVLPENVNYAVKSSLLLSFLESVPDVAAKLKEPNTKEESFEDVVKSAQDAAVLVLVY
ncbi:MAG TPA: tetratricopeptide repeat-containing serine protease family protein [Candidatus Acidoferrales bacterium]|jgi:TPR repeat protein|nr:tetratricopeptide repeat-containing serine protease family protein [Candidatus Acidoferrales bacterium]